jgi:hypothetical protein
MSKNEFSVYWWDINGVCTDELRFVSAQDAVDRASFLAHGPGAKIGVISRIIITDGLDLTCFEWLKDKGVVFPGPDDKYDGGLEEK